MSSAIARVVVLLACTFLGTCSAHAGGVTPYFESSANQKPRGDAGVSVTSDRIKLDADLALRAPDRDTLIIPQVSSALALTSRLGVETNIRFDDWNSDAEASGANIDTKLHFQSSVPFLKELEGRVWRSPDGQSGRILKFGFYQRLGDGTGQTPLTLRSNASFESTAPSALGAPPDSPLPGDSRRVRLETELGGLMARMRGRTAIRIRLDKVVGAAPETTGSVAYDHAWRVGPADLGLNLKMLGTSAAVEPSLGLSWHWRL